MPTPGLLKVLHVIYSLDTGGAQQVVKNYALLHDQSRYQVVVCALTSGGDIVAELRNAGIKVHLLKKSRRWDFSVLPKLAATIRAESPDLIHVHDDMSNNWTALALGWRQRIPVVLTIHKVYEPDSSPYFRAHQFLSRMIYRRNSYLICCSEAVRRSLQLSSVLAERIVTIHNGIDLGQLNLHLSDCALAAFNNTTADNIDNGCRIGTIGSLRVEKGHEYLLRAAQILKQKSLSVRFYLVGDGDKRLYLEKLAHQLDIHDMVNFLGYRSDVGKWLKAFDLVVFPSITEGLPLAVLEALAMRKTVIASAIGGIPEVIQHDQTGWLVPPANPVALAEAIAKALHQPQECQRLAAQGFQRVAAEFTTERMVRKTERIYGKALSSRKLTALRISAKGINSFHDLRVLFITMFPVPTKAVPPNQTALLADHLEKEGAQVLRAACETRRGLKTIKFAAALLRYRRSYDIAQIQTTPSVGFINTAVVIGIGKLLGKKVISNYFTAAGPIFLERFKKVTVPILKRADGVVVASNYVGNKLQALGLHVKFIPHLIDLAQWRFKFRRQFTPHLLWVKRFDPEAGPEIMLRVFQALKQQAPEARLVMIGDGPLRESCCQFVRRHRLSDVDLPGFVLRENLPAYYDAADIFVLTSKIDNQPMCVLEAMACGLPVIAPKVGGLPDMIEDRVSGLLVDSDEPFAMANAIQFLLQHPEQARLMAFKAWQSLERYRWEKVRKKWLELYYEIIKKRHDFGNLQQIS